MVPHADYGSKSLAVVYIVRSAQLTLSPRRVLVHALAEAVNGLHQTELIRGRGHWHTVEHVEFATLEDVPWWNNQRHHRELEYSAPFVVSRGTTPLKTNQHALAKEIDMNENQIRSLAAGPHVPEHRSVQSARWIASWGSQLHEGGPFIVFL